jgi:hypothetical protein
MRTLRQFSMVVALTVVFATSGFAGIIGCPPAPAPPPPPENQAAGIIDTPPSAEAEPSDPTVELALTVLRTVLSVF